MNEGLSFVRRMQTSYTNDETGQLACQVIRFDWFSLVGYAPIFAAPVGASPRAASNT